MGCFYGSKLCFESLGGERGHRKPVFVWHLEVTESCHSPPPHMLRRALSEEGITEDRVPEAEG